MSQLKVEKMNNVSDNFRIISSFSGIMFYEYDLISQKYTLFENAEAVLGYSLEDLNKIFTNAVSDNGMVNIIHPEDVFILKEQDTIFANKGEVKFESRLKCADGNYHWFYINKKIVKDENGNSISVLGCIMSTDVFYKEREKLRQKISLEPMTGLINKVSALEIISDIMSKKCDSTHALIFFDMDNFKKANDTLGHSMGDRIIKYIADTLKDVFDETTILSRFGGDEFMAFLPDISSKSNVIKKIRSFNEIIKECAILKNTDVNISMSIGVAFSKEGITSKELLDMADKATYSAKEKGKATYCIYGDEKLNVTEASVVSGIADRNEFLRIVDERVSCENYNSCLVAIDIEHFKLFNRLYGRDKGDLFLSKLADYIIGFENKYDAVAGYFGGDNFALFMPNNPTLIEELEDGCKNIALGISSSVGFLPAFGIYKMQDEVVSAMSMYDFATIALGFGRGNYIKRSVVYKPSMTDNIEKELDLLTELESALEKDEIALYLQPKVNLYTKKIVGAEVLSRWIHPKKGIIPPLDYIPILEKNGFISNFDKHVWEKVCKTLRKLEDDGIKMVPVSVNVSRVDMLSIDVAEYLKGLVDKYNIDTEAIRIEITESAYGSNVEAIQKTILKLKEYGFCIFMDDFGSGYSSLNNLKSLYLDGLKIDMKFLEIDRMEEEKGLRILESVVKMAHSINLPVIVEGIETAKQEEYLHSLNCLFGQGFYYYRPTPEKDFIEIIKDKNNIDDEGIIARWQRKNR